MNLRTIITTILVSILFVPTFLEANNKLKEDSILVKQILEIKDDDFKAAVIEVLQSNNLTNKKLFINEIEKVRNKQAQAKKRVYGFENVERFNGWTTTFSGILVVFSGLILIAVVITVFNKFFAGNSESKPEQQHVNIFEEVKKENKSSIPEEELVAITTALELYKRLYADSIPTRLTFREVDQGTWKLKYKFGHRQN